MDAAEKGDMKTLQNFLENKHHDPNIPKPDKVSIWKERMVSEFFLYLICLFVCLAKLDCIDVGM